MSLDSVATASMLMASRLASRSSWVRLLDAALEGFVVVLEVFGLAKNGVGELGDDAVTVLEIGFGLLEGGDVGEGECVDSGGAGGVRQRGLR